jgi:nucleotide-binding universal stress UspA family protein
MSSESADRGILVGVDGSDRSDAAVRWAAREAGLRNVPLSVVHVLPTPMGGWGGWGITAIPLPEDFFQQLEAEGRRIIADATRVAKEAVGDTADIRVRGEVIYAPSASTLVELSNNSQMIVVGCRGQGGLQRVLLGSISTALVHHAHCPVAVIHDEAVAGSDAPVVVGIDGSPASELATAIAFDEASWRGVELVALHAWSDAESSELPTPQWSVVCPGAEEELAERLAGWQERYPDVRVRRVVVMDQPARHLLIEAGSAQLVVVGSHGRGGFARMLLGSVGTAVVHAARVPVIVARQR